MMQPVNEQDLLKLVERLLWCRQDKVCRHAVALDILSLMEAKGYTHPDFEALVKATVDANDEAALTPLRNCIEKPT